MSQRKSARISAKVELAPVPLTSSTMEATKKPPKKPRPNKTKAIDESPKDTKKRTRSRGKLRNMTEMPVDVLLEIFSALLPTDLLSLSRANKSLREILASNNTAYLWRQVYKNVPEDKFKPPSCPDGVNARRYTNYLYGRHCQFCASPHGHYDHFGARVRFCKKCMMKVLLSVHTASTEICDLCVSYFVSVPGNRGSYVLKTEYRLRSGELARAKAGGKKKTHVYKARREGEIETANQIASRLNEWRDTQHKQALVMRADRISTSKDSRKQRLEFIKDKLKGEGYGRLTHWEVIHLPHTGRDKKLDDEGWLRIRADVIEAAQDLREIEEITVVQGSIRKSLYSLSKFMRTLDIPAPHLMPRAFLIALNEPFSSFIQQRNADIPSSTEFEPFTTECLALIAAWKAQSDDYLIDLIPVDSSRKGKRKRLDSSALGLATTFFKCYFCTEPISYPRILTHRCLRETSTNSEELEGDGDIPDEEADEDVESVIPTKGRPREPRPPRAITVQTLWETIPTFIPTGFRAGHLGVTFDEESYTLSRKIIKACGQDPNTATHEVMKINNARLKCETCRKAREGGKGRANIAMRWLMAILHDMEYHSEEESNWKLVESEEEIAQIKELESTLTKKSNVFELLCKLCGDSVTREDSHAHLIHWHDETLKNVRDWDMERVLGYYLPNLDLSIQTPPFPVRY